MFPRPLLRFVAFLLVPCLLADPSLAAFAAGMSPHPKLSVFSSRFNEQALTPTLADFNGAAVESQMPNSQVKIGLDQMGAKAIRSSKNEEDLPTPVAGTPRLVGVGKIGIQDSKLRVELSPTDAETVAYRILLGFSPGSEYFSGALLMLRRLVVEVASRWWPSRKGPGKDLHEKWKTWVADDHLESDYASPMNPAFADQRKTIVDDLWQLSRFSPDAFEKLMTDLVKEAASHLGIILQVSGQNDRVWTTIQRVEFVMNAGVPLAYDASRRVLQADLFTFIYLLTRAGSKEIRTILAKLQREQSEGKSNRGRPPALATPTPPSVTIPWWKPIDDGFRYALYALSILLVVVIGLALGSDSTARHLYNQLIFPEAQHDVAGGGQGSPGGKNVYDPDAPADPHGNVTYDRIETVMVPYRGTRAQGVLIDSGYSGVSDGSGQPRHVATFREIVDIKLSGHEAPGLMLMDIANALVEEGGFAAIETIDFVPSNALTHETTQVQVRIPPVRKGTAMRLPIEIDQRVDPASLSDPRLWSNAQGWLTANQDIPNGTTLTGTLIRTSENGSFQGSQPMTAWMQKERADIPSYMRQELDRARGLSDHDRASIVAGLLYKYYGYRKTALVQLAEGTWMNFTATQLQTHELMLGDCDVLVANAFTLLRDVGIRSFIVVGRNNSDGQSLVRKDRAHAWLVVEIDGKWQIFDPSSYVRYFPDSLPAGSNPNPANEHASASTGHSNASTTSNPSVNAIEPSPLTLTDIEAQPFIPNTALYPKTQTPAEVAAKEERRRQLNPNQTSTRGDIELPGRKNSNEHPMQTGQSFAEIAHDPYGQGDDWFWLAADNILLTLNGDIDRLRADVVLSVRPHRSARDPEADLKWEKELLQKNGRAWYERRQAALQAARVREMERPSAYTDDVQKELRRRMKGVPVYDKERRRPEFLAAIARSRGVQFRRDDWIRYIDQTLAIGKKLFETPTTPVPQAQTPQAQQSGVGHLFSEIGHLFSVTVSAQEQTAEEQQIDKVKGLVRALHAAEDRARAVLGKKKDAPDTPELTPQQAVAAIDQAREELFEALTQLFILNPDAVYQWKSPAIQMKAFEVYLQQHNPKLYEQYVNHPKITPGTGSGTPRGGKAITHLRSA